ncbi:hypothetical protein TYRP_017514 [Tyrophagus putrescentiae]|nr:hypothetical protein TYRP_017514 [Tyrophagus putrescentiae]
MTTPGHCERPLIRVLRADRTKDKENPFLYDVFAVIENGIKTPPSLSAPSTAVTILTTCTSYNVMLYLEDVLVQWLGLSRMNKEPNANCIHNETEWNNFEFMYGQHRLQTSVSEKIDNSNLTLVGGGGGGGGGGKQQNDNIPCLHRYHHLALGEVDNDQVTFVPFNCVPEERFIVPLLECSIYRKLAAKISTDIGMVFDEAINKILTRGELPHFAANARKSFKQFVLSFYNYMNNIKDQIDKDYLKKTRNLSVFEEKHLLSHEMAYAKYRDALAYFDYFVMTYIFQHRYKLNQKLFPPACYHCIRHFNPLENLVSSAEIM